MAAIISSNFRSLNAAAFVEEVKGDRSNVYIGLGKSSPWGGTTTANTSDTDAPAPSDTLDGINEARQQLIGLKLVTDKDISHVVPRYDWNPGAEFVAWDSTDPAIHDKAFYCLTADFKVYKCIIAPVSGGVSDVPTHVDAAITSTTDGYHWKYMYTILAADSEKFLTNSYMPVKTLTEITTGVVAASLTSTSTFAINHENDRIIVGQKLTIAAGSGSGATGVPTDVTVASVSGKTLTTSAAIGAINGGNIVTFGDFLATDPRHSQQQSQIASREITSAQGIERLKLIAGGTGYNDDGSGISITITGDGSGVSTPGAVKANYVSGGAFVSDIIINGDNATEGTDSVGADYSVAQAVIAGGGGSNASFVPIISPRGRPGFNSSHANGGHGCDPVFELGGFYVGLNVQISGTADSAIANTQDFRQISLIRNPLIGGVIPTNPADAINTLKFITYDTAHTASSGSSGTNTYTNLGIQLAQAVQDNDHVLENGTTGFKGYIVNVDTTNKRIYYFQNDLTGYIPPTDANMVIKTGGQEISALALDASAHDLGVNAAPSSFNAGSGEVLFLENRDPIQRSTSQIEDVKLIIEF